jgi:hypothetical protein
VRDGLVEDETERSYSKIHLKEFEGHFSALDVPVSRRMKWKNGL